MSGLNGKFFYYITTSPQEVLNRFNPNLNGVYLSSSLDPYTEEFIDNHRTLRYFFNKHGIPSYRIHASGHIMPHHLINFINKVSPEYLIPVHTDYPKLFTQYFKKSRINVVLPNRYESVDL